MDYISYAKFISQMDIGIIDGLCSQALGNISLLLFFEKKIFFNKKGIIARTFAQKGIPYYPINQISRMSMKEFAAPVSYSEVDKKDIEFRPMKDYIEEWDDVFAYLDKID